MYFQFFQGAHYSIDQIDLSYDAQQNVQKIARADNISIEVNVKDVRTQTDGAPSKGVANQAAAIISNQDVSKLVKEAIERELAQRGYMVSPGHVIIMCDLSNFWAKWEMGFWAGKAHGSCQFMVKVLDQKRTLIFSDIISGESTKDGIQLTSGDNAKEVLELALKDAMKKLFQTQDFFDAIAKAAGKERMAKSDIKE